MSQDSVKMLDFLGNPSPDRFQVYCYLSDSRFDVVAFSQARLSSDPIKGQCQLNDRKHRSFLQATRWQRCRLRTVFVVMRGLGAKRRALDSGAHARRPHHVAR